MTTRRRFIIGGCAIGLALVFALFFTIAWGIYGSLNAPQPAWSVAWNADSKTLAAGFGGYGTNEFVPRDQDTTVRLWDIGRLDEKPVVLRKHTSRVLGLAISRDGKWLASGDEWGKALLWDLRDLAKEPIVMDDDEYPDTGSQSLDFSPDGRWLAGSGGSYHEAGVWDLTDPLNPSIGLTGTQDTGVGEVAFLPDGKTVAAPVGQSQVQFWRLGGPEPQPTLQLDADSEVTTIAVSPDGRWLAGGGDGGAAWLWDLSNTGERPERLPGDGGLYTSMDFHPTGKLLAASTRDDYRGGKVRVWDLTRRSDPSMEAHGAGDFITSLQFSPDGKWLAASGYDGKIRLWAADKLGDSPTVLKR